MKISCEGRREGGGERGRKGGREGGECEDGYAVCLMVFSFDL
jgi:hypothetical protein